MARSVPEWVGKTDDSRPPQSVQIRLFESARGMCQSCNVKLKPGGWHIDHRCRLKDGENRNRESNLQILCHACHREKTGQENKGQVKANRVKAKAYGVKKAGRAVPGSKQSKWKRQWNKHLQRWETVERS